MRKQGDGDQGGGETHAAASDWPLAHIRPSDWLVATLEVADEETPADTALLTIMVIIL